MIRTKFFFAVLCGLLLWGASASARDYIASGNNNGLTGPQPQAQAPIYGKLSQTGSAPATIVVPERIAPLSYDFFFPIPSPSFFQATRMGENGFRGPRVQRTGGPRKLRWRCPAQASATSLSSAGVSSSTRAGA